MPRSSDPLDDAVALMLDGDTHAFSEVFRAVQPRLVRYLRALVGPDDAEDVASDTWSQVVRDLGSFKGDADGFKAWVSTIGRHRALDHHRTRSRRPQSVGPIEELPERAASDDVEDAVQTIFSTEDAVELIASLPQEQAEAVLLRAVMGLDAKSAGRVLGRSPGAVRTAAYRGLRALSARVEARPSDTSEPSVAEEMR